ncbi:MAG: BlaR1 family beta-lactam sensor/signal transducer [Bacillota bacterium]|uniref:BlaR1 family beta-lactam sensor/signal transducer n=1 Tax=Virgibacillus salarius TaxID=447199 RepID=A0A941DSX1_9BACI|nr:MULTISPECIES: BlaR1 family beta-lactam sensor/signal transducer [Bacillaceae]NAZ07506.1 BlaR1 family beta-lactam sensor/signal transducer [Agaribacter marinus]MBR7794786.1 BlaR1 family beta-lactam sensor/signal transducer [Virgibacillus salarius]MCC2249817.1 BlaR1 family beta-lactam sensor/signal transducer [Virgibacillus sp. AGTR]MDY7046269.1 BlaR1 family beta-lactam sensor/signal transducer [Virgibacillus sp. M23]QRZ19278.1 BlaR1 family beta-lactam sensor/signal transducer [Virgibacillus 
MDFIHFMISFMVSSFTVVVITLIRKLFKNQLSAKWRYHLWFLLLFALTLPFIPTHYLHVGNYLSMDGKQANQTPSSTTLAEEPQAEVNWMQDFSVSVNRMDLTALNEILVVIWILGMLLFTALTIHSWLKLKKIKRATYSIGNNEILSLFEQCKQRLNVTKQINIGISPLVKSPMTFGLFKTYIVLPSHFEKWLSMEEIKYILLHELNHYKYKDIAINYLVVMYQIVYWFNPFVWFAFKEMRLDREIACDIAVLKLLDKQKYRVYGNTIINFVDKNSQSREHFILTNQLNGSKRQIKRRIESIASYTTESKLLKLKSLAIFMLVGLFVTSQIPIISATTAEDNHHKFKHERTIYEDLSNYFVGYEGSFVLYSIQDETYRIYNEEKSTLRVSPNSTYKIYSALFGLESNVITNENSTLKWNGMQYPYDSWNQDQNLTTAMKNSVSWYFQRLDQHVSKDNIQAYLKTINYGNKDISAGLSNYWLESSLKVSPIEQVNALKDFYTNKYGFKDKNIQTVKDAIKLEEKDGMILSGKTGTGSVNGKNISGWFIGYVETEADTFFFATNIQNEASSYGSKAAEITLSILRDKDIY